MNEHLRRAVEALEAGTAEIRALSRESTSEIRAQLRRTADDLLRHLERDAETPEAQADDLMSRLSRQSQDIAEDLRRAERLMRERTGRE